MNGSVIALLAVAALFAFVPGALAASEATCSAVAQGTSNLSGNAQSMVNGALNCASSGGGGTPVVATTEPLAALLVGAGLLGARLLRRR